ncbi:hypothetical protein WJX74_010763 [Apatococcus lobatus]|uniref:Uncharacterized protein n=2 Tax=Apatococcus TaxID=904362 RepID=A0AAW1T1N2_9CHLO
MVRKLEPSQRSDLAVQCQLRLSELNVPQNKQQSLAGGLFSPWQRAQQGTELIGTQQARHNATKPVEAVVEKMEDGPGPPVIIFKARQGGATATKAIVPMEADTSSAPSAASSVGAMSFGALGAVGIAALGVFGVYQMSAWVADKSGRSMDADATGVPGPPIILSAELLKARKAAMEAEYAALRMAPNSREVELRLRQLQDEAAALQ